MILNAIASEIRRPVDASKSKNGRQPSRDLGEQPGELLAREKAPLVELVCAAAPTARQDDHRFRPVAEKPRTGSVPQAGHKRRHRVAHRAIAEPMPVLVDQPTQPVDERTRLTLVDVAEPLARPEVDKGVRDQQAPVLAARAIVDDVVGAAAGVVVDPLQRVAVQRWSRAPAGLLGGASDLDLTRLAKRRRELFALTAVLTIDRHPPRSAAVDPGVRSGFQHPGVSGCPRCCHPNGFVRGRNSPPALGSCERAREDSNL